MDSKQATKHVEDFGAHLFEKSKQGKLYLKLDVKDIEAAIRLQEFLFLGKNSIVEGVVVSSIDWGVADASEKLKMISDILNGEDMRDE